MLALTFEILKYLLPAIVFYFIVKMVMDAYLKNEEKKRATGDHPSENQITLPLRLQACERLVLLMERIAPVQLINRVLKPGMNVYEFQKLLVQVIREEFDHNVAQQIYVSADVWSLIKTAKEEIIMIINTLASETENDSDGSKLARKLIEHWSDQEKNSWQIAVDQLKKEARQMF